MEYRTQKLRDKERLYENNGGIEGRYTLLADQGCTRKEIAYMLGMSVPALAAWITKWNSARRSHGARAVGRRLSMYRTKFHRDGTVTVWNVYTQTWIRTSRPSDAVLASMANEERAKVIAHCGRKK